MYIILSCCQCHLNFFGFVDCFRSLELGHWNYGGKEGMGKIRKRPTVKFNQFYGLGFASCPG
jgi:hypothetical protein